MPQRPHPVPPTLALAALVLITPNLVARSRAQEGPSLTAPVVSPSAVPTTPAPPLGVSPSATPGSPSIPAPSRARAGAGIPPASDADAEILLAQALELERQHKWSAAIEVYEKALERWPARVDLRHRMRLCETHYRLNRRYQDRSFRSVLLRMPQSQALDLYDEILERIQSHYVEPISFVPLLRRGIDNLEVALRDATFLKSNVPGADAGRVQAVRQWLATRREQILAADRREARLFVNECCTVTGQTIGLAPAAVAMEFAYGACDSLDDYTAYLSPDRLEDLFAVIDGNFVGLGVELKTDDQGLKLVGVIPGGPAAEAGIKAGEKIVQIGGKSIAGLGLDEAASQLQGAAGTSVDLVILDARGQTRAVRVPRREVEVKSVTTARIVDPAGGTGYVRLDGFQKSSTDELRAAIATLQQQGLKFLILDLRGNPGGLLDVAVEIADEFLDNGVIVSTRGRAVNQSMVYRARPGAAWRMPVAILIDHDSASASEILAGALKDNRRAQILGERSFGKGSVQSIFQLRTAPAGLKLTTAKFYSPLNRSYSEQGVDPDIQVRTVLKPAADSPAEPAETAADRIGKPETDPVLQRAMSQARRQLTVNR